MYRHLERARYLATAASSRNTKPSELANLDLAESRLASGESHWRFLQRVGDFWNAYLAESRLAMSGGEWRRLQKLGDVEPYEF